MTDGRRSINTSLVAIPDAMISTLSGIYDVLNSLELLGTFEDAVPRQNPFRAEIVASQESIRTASGLPVSAQRLLDEVDHTDIVIVPSVMVQDGEWKTGRYPRLVGWLERMHEGGAILCSACSGVLLLAETGLLDGREATVHWAYADTFLRNFPNVRLRLENALVVTGERQEFVMSGASASWHDLVLYLVARHVGPTAAQAMAKFMLLQWHLDGQAPYVVFQPPTGHDDATIMAAQRWLAKNYRIAAPVEEMVRRSGLAERTFKRRFKEATQYSPIAYVQQLRVEEAKRRLERTDDPIDEISWKVGYEDPAFFRRLFKRIAGMTPGAYRRKFRIPSFATESGETTRLA